MARRGVAWLFVYSCFSRESQSFFPEGFALSLLFSFPFLVEGSLLMTFFLIVFKFLRSIDLAQGICWS